MPSVNGTTQHSGSFTPPEAPVFRPTAEEFEHPLRYIASIRPTAEAFGICKVIPPAGWKPPYVVDRATFRFKTRIQSVHELQERPDTQEAADQFQEEFEAFLQSTGRPVKKAPVFGGTPIDLSKLYKVVLKRGGYESVTQNKGWRDVGRILQVGTRNFVTMLLLLVRLSTVHLTSCSWKTKAIILLIRFGKSIRSICWPLKSMIGSERTVQMPLMAHRYTLVPEQTGALVSLETMQRRLQIF